MAITRQQKEKAVQTLKDELARMNSLVFVNYYGLTVPEIEEFRQMTDKEQCRYLVAKKSLFQLALKEAGLEEMVDMDKIKGGMGLVFGFGDMIQPARLAVKFAKDHEQMVIYGGVLDAEFIDPAKVKALSRLPSRQQLLGQLVRTIQGPVSGLVGVLQGNLRNLVCLLSQIKGQKAN